MTHTVSRRRDINLRLHSRSGEVLRSDILLECLHGSGLDQINGAAAKSPAGHARADDTALRGGNFDHEVELFATYFVVVTKAAMRLAHQCSQSADVTGLKSMHRTLHAIVFRDNVVATQIHFWVQKRSMPFQLDGRDVSKRVDFRQYFAQHSNAFFTLRAPHIVLAGADFVLHHGVADHELNAGWQFHQFVFQRTAIEQQRMRSAPVARNKLIHDADARADKFVLRSLTQSRQLGEIDDETALVQEGEANRYFDGRRGTETGTERNITADKKIRAEQPLPCPLEQQGNTERVAGPVLLARGGDGIETRFDGFIEICGMDDQLSVAARSGRHAAIEFNGGRQNKAVVVVGVLADEIHAPRRPIKGGGRGKARAELFQKLKWIFQRPYYFRFAFGEAKEFAAEAPEKSATPMRITVSRVVMFSGFSVQIP